jgi:hypothetical protein
MWNNLFNKVKTLGLNFLGLGKNNRSQNGLINKAKGFVSGFGDFLNNKAVKSAVQGVSNFIPQIGDYYKTSKKYMNIADQFVNQQGLSKKFDRIVKKLPESQAPSLEKMKPDKSTDYLGEYDTGGLLF